MFGIGKNWPPSKADGPDRHVVGTIDPRDIEAALREIGPPDSWPPAARDRHHILDEGRSLILRNERHVDMPMRWKLPAVEAILGRVTSLGLGESPGKIVIALLPPGRVIKPHRDSGQYYTFHNRIHVPLVTNPDVRVTVGGECFHMSVGHIYLFQNLRRHSVHNASSAARIHLIVDMLDPRYSEATYRLLYRVLQANVLGAATLFRMYGQSVARRSGTRPAASKELPM
ncbi:MAG: aspartyl/asparaginyl beta-hydroxylase domain-containing protein [Polyangiaceae bacterium]|jgi:hypothetical protein